MLKESVIKTKHQPVLYLGLGESIPEASGTQYVKLKLIFGDFS